jgi:hypothetical protein
VHPIDSAENVAFRLIGYFVQHVSFSPIGFSKSQPPVFHGPYVVL